MPESLLASFSERLGYKLSLSTRLFVFLVHALREEEEGEHEGRKTNKSVVSVQVPLKA